VQNRKNIVCDILLIGHFVALTPSWHSSQARRSLNPCVLQNASYKTRIVIHIQILAPLTEKHFSVVVTKLCLKQSCNHFWMKFLF
jgi:hypothetical protein